MHSARRRSSARSACLHYYWRPQDRAGRPAGHDVTLCWTAGLQSPSLHLFLFSLSVFAQRWQYDEKPCWAIKVCATPPTAPPPIDSGMAATLSHPPDHSLSNHFSFASFSFHISSSSFLFPPGSAERRRVQKQTARTTTTAATQQQQQHPPPPPPPP